MFSRFAGTSFLALCWGAALAAPVAPPAASGPINWPAFLGRQDLVWANVPPAWENSPFIGNGNLGATIHQGGAGGLAWEVGQTDITHGGSRYPMGRLVLQTGGTIMGGEARLNLWNAEASGVLHTPRGDVTWRSFVAATPSVIVIEYSGTKGENQMDLLWLASPARPPTQTRRGGTLTPDSLHPPPTVTTGVGSVTSTQRFLGGGAFAVALRRISPLGGKTVYVLGVGRGETEDSARVGAEGADEQAAALGIAELTAAHRKRWHQYYPASFLSIPDPRLEAFYWIQIYKLGSAMRPDGPILDLMGPWFRATSWPHLWWNLNTELAYSPLFTANRLGLAESLFGNLDRHRQALINNVPPALRAEGAAIGRISDQSLVSPVNPTSTESDADREVGDLPWVMHLYWEYYRYQMDDAILRDRVLPLLSRAMGPYLAIVQKTPDGRYHLPRTFSPQLMGVADANYDLALLRWGLQTLIASCERLKINDRHLPQWRDVLAHLTPFPADASGLMVGRARPLRESNGHYSHLLAIYPLHVLTPDGPVNRKLIEDSLHNWNTRTEKFRGYSYTGAASIYADLGDGERALDHLHVLLDRFVQPNTFYAREAVLLIETPLSGATSLQEMLLQSWGGKLRVFPAMPAAVEGRRAFGTLRGEGAFLVSAVRQGGQTAWVRVQSLAGSPCRVVVSDWSTAAVHSASAPLQTVLRGANGEFNLVLPKQAWAVLAPDGAPDVLPLLGPVEGPVAEPNPLSGALSVTKADRNQAMASTRGSVLLAAAVIVLAGVAAYANSLGGALSFSTIPRLSRRIRRSATSGRPGRLWLPRA